MKWKFNLRNSLLAVAVGSLGFTACTDLEEELLDSSTGEELLEEIQQGLQDDPEGTSAQLYLPVYESLRRFVPQDGIYALLEHSTDEMQGPTRGTDWDDGGVWRVLHTHDWDPNHRMVGAAWNDMNEGVARAYLALQIFDDAGAGSNVDPFRAEIRFLRAWFMFYVMDLYGQVPAIDEDSGEAIVLSRAEAYDFITSELEDIVNILPDDNPYPRVDKFAAHALAAKVYLNAGVYRGDGAFNGDDMDRVISHASAVMNSQYDFEGDYFGIFKPENADNSEALVVFQNFDEIDQGVPSGSRVMMTLHYNMEFGNNYQPWNGFTTIADFYNRWDQDDPRFFQPDDDGDGIAFGFLQGQQFDGDGNALEDRNGNPLIFTVECPLFGASEPQGVRVIKYSPDNDTPDAVRMDNDYMLLRYSDVVLMKAEAEFRSGSSDAVNTLNMVRNARGADDLSSVDEDAILDERGFELYWEGHRRNDLIRFDRFTDAYTNKDASAETAKLFPIPQTALDVNPNLSQNPGYN